MPNANYTHIQVLLDRSGSMDLVRTDMEGGFNTFLSEQQDLPGKATISLGQFNNSYESVYEMTPIQDAPALKLSPSGGTALLDAMAISIDKLGNRLRTLPDAKRPGTVLFVIITDGYENASRSYSTDAVFKRVTTQQEQFGWQFIYLGANQDAIEVSRSYGIPMASSMTYGADSHGTHAVMDSFSSTVSSTRSAAVAGQSTNINFTDAERRNAVDKPSKK